MRAVLWPCASSARDMARAPISVSGSRTVLGAGEVAALLVRRHDRVAGQLVPADDADPAARAGVRPELALECLRERRVVVARAGQHDRGDLLGAQQLHVLELARRVAVAVADD